MTGYELSRQWFDFSFENPEKVRPIHTAIYFFAIEKWNRMGKKEKFGLPSLHTMEVLGIKSKNTYYKGFNDLISFGFIKVVEKSKNQNTANIISLPAVSKNKSADKSALDSALIQHVSQQREHIKTSKQVNKETKEQTLFEKTFEDFKKMRKQIKKPMTDKAVELMLKKLTKLSGGDENIKIEILERSIMNSWQGVFPLSDEKQSNDPKPEPPKTKKPSDWEIFYKEKEAWEKRNARA